MKHQKVHLANPNPELGYVAPLCDVPDLEWREITWHHILATCKDCLYVHAKPEVSEALRAKMILIRGDRA